VPSRRRLIVVANRGPVTFARDARGERVAQRGAGGLVTALRPFAARNDVTWIASAMSDEDRVVADDGVIEVGDDGSRVRLRLVRHASEAYDLYYDVVANPALWFVQHGLWALKQDPSADLLRPWRDGYCVVNAAFADAVLDELQQAPDAAVMFQDYHLYVAPRLVRERRPGVLMSHFVHIPWVGPEQWAVLPPPIVLEIHESLLANDVVGFHTARWRDAFLATCAALLARDASRSTHVAVAPISVDPAEFDDLAESPTVLERERELAAGRPERLILRVDRTDPSKNIVRGFAAYRRLLERRPDLHGRVGLIALLAPSRQSIPEYLEYRAEIEAAAENVNARFARPGWRPLVLDVRDDLTLSVAAYKQFDVLLVNPVMDGLNLVAKEAPLVNRRDGVVVLSREAGAFEELADWVVPVDPYDVEGQADALEQALELPAAERRRRLAAIDSWVREHDVDAWTEAQLAALEYASTMRA
jgi:trehalose 6-phosphate synthase